MFTEKKPIFLWKSMQAGIKSAHGKVKWKIGKWEKEKEASACNVGFHASENVIQAMGFVNAEIIAKVEVRGKSDIRDDKQAWTKMRIVEAYEWTKEDSVRLAIYAAELVIDIFEKKYPKDDRPRKAIEAAKKYLDDPSAYAANAAYAAANAAYTAYAAYAAAADVYAAYAAANAANAAAANAAAYAAYAAANAAAYAANAYAAYAAYAAVYAAAAYAAEKEIRVKCHKFVLKLISKKTPIK